jgi:hypothetical protein
MQTSRAINGSPIQTAGTNQLSDTLSGTYLNAARDQYDNSPLTNDINNLALAPTLRGDYVKNAPGMYWSAPAAQGVNNFTGSTLNGDYLYGGQGFNAAVDAAGRKIIPQVQSAFEKSGRTNSGLAQTAMTQALSDSFAQQYGQERQNQLQAAQLGNTSNDSYLQTIARERQNQLQAAQTANTSNQSYLDMLSKERENQIRSMLFAPQMASLDYQDYSKLGEVGSQRETLDQQKLADQIARWDYQQNAARNSAAGYMNLIQGNYGGQTVGTSNSDVASGGGGGMNIMGGVGGLLASSMLGVNPIVGLLGGLGI